MGEYERTKEQIAKILFYAGLKEDSADTLGYVADEILSLVEIKADDQSLPESILSILGMRLVNATVKVMLKAGFVKVVPKPNV